MEKKRIRPFDKGFQIKSSDMSCSHDRYGSRYCTPRESRAPLVNPSIIIQ